jgi:aspartyl-tRNA(Asn)/glutamyl-tRNA(Gln) amidotransferase subunit B
MRDHGLRQYDADILTDTPAMAAFFEATLEAGAPARSAVNWCLGEVSRLLNLNNTAISEARITPGGLADLIGLVETGKINQTSAKTILEEMFTTGAQPMDVVQSKSLLQIGESDELSAAVDSILQQNPQAVADYHAGKAQAIGFLVGQVMKQTRGRANPGVVTGLLKQKLGTNGPGA